MYYLPYPIPERIKTKKRCQFSLPNRRYNCRCIGAYVLNNNNKHYCAHHYGIAWKVANPEIGQQHDWHIHINRFTGEPDRYETCRRCMVIKVHDGLPQSPCRGVMPQIVLR